MDNPGFSKSWEDTEEPVMSDVWAAPGPGGNQYEMNIAGQCSNEKNDEVGAGGGEMAIDPVKTLSKTQHPEVQVEEEDVNHEGLSLVRQLLSGWYVLLVLLLPVVLLPLALSIEHQYQMQARCAYVIIIMAILWTTEALPLSVTSLVPVVLLPALGVMRARDVSAQYFNDTSMLFIGGLVVAIAVEVWDVHRRLALLVLKLVGAEPKRLLLGITLVTWFLSMWISNTATAAMMMTIVHALLQQFKQVDNETARGKHAEGLQVNGDPGNHVGVEPLERSEVDQASEDERHQRLKKAISLAVAYAANIGGIGSLTGTGPNLVFFAAANQLFRQYGLRSPVTFATWLVFGLPLSFLAVLIMWGWLIFFYLRCRGCCTRCGCGEGDDEDTIKQVNETISQEYTKMGPVTYAQASVLTCFVTLVLAWITRSLGGGGEGWGDWFPQGFVSDSTPSTLAAILLFTLPSTLPAIFTEGFRSNRPASYNSIKPLLTWKSVHEKMPWNLYLLLGGGFAIARASEVVEMCNLLMPEELSNICCIVVSLIS
ncbi:solute carrier family 13 member 2 [Elysia marginata]|uniref:Solute carrier family 13 member 2 n=1 Tax=Elysia marginata TaxID=1093978 RepID=A0AAV4HIS4_9GAST|nr:solute carrier family 13 member 2 [Elysia marginata]